MKKNSGLLFTSSSRFSLLHSLFLKWFVWSSGRKLNWHMYYLHITTIRIAKQITILTMCLSLTFFVPQSLMYYHFFFDFLCNTTFLLRHV